MSKRERAFLLSMLVAGCVLRVVWPADMEWKYDEQTLFWIARSIAQTGAWPELGMESGVGTPNPALSVWLFGAIAHAAKTPLGMVAWVQLANVATLIAWWAWVTRVVPAERRRPWLWGLALMAVSPLPIVFSRKIWAQCLLPPFTLLALAGHARRDRIAGAFLWGLSGALIGQVHMSGFFFAAGLLAWSVWSDRGRDTRWLSWLLGTVLGAAPLIPWLIALLAGSAGPSLAWRPNLKFYSQWLGIAFGIDLKHPLGEVFGTELVRLPIIGGVPTYGVAALHAFLIGTGLFALARWVRARGTKKRGTASMDSESPRSEARYYVKAALIAIGGLFTLAGFATQAHYLIVLFPLPFVWMALAFANERRLLAAIVIAQLLISATFLGFIHRRGGAPEAEYGATYRVQE
jgi:hypothetical protein